MSAGLKGNVGDLRKLTQRLNKLPMTMVHSVAQRSAPVLSGETKSAFASKRSVYGDAYPDGKDGEQLTLVDSGLTRDTISFSATGTRIRAVLAPKYTKYLIGKYNILPNGPMPVTWVNEMQQIVESEKAGL